MLRVLFSRIAEPHAGGPGAYSCNVPSVSGSGAMKDATGKKTVVKNFTRTGGMCPECAGTGRASKFDEAQVVDDSLSIGDVIDLGPGAVSAGGQVVAAGTVRTLVDTHESTGSETGRYLAYAAG